jgi:hypothetical protein
LAWNARPGSLLWLPDPDLTRSLARPSSFSALQLEFLPPPDRLASLPRLRPQALPALPVSRLFRPPDPLA